MANLGLFERLIKQANLYTDDTRLAWHHEAGEVEVGGQALQILPFDLAVYVVAGMRLFKGHYQPGPATCGPRT